MDILDYFDNPSATSGVTLTIPEEPKLYAEDGSFVVAPHPPELEGEDLPEDEETSQELISNLLPNTPKEDAARVLSKLHPSKQINFRHLTTRHKIILAYHLQGHTAIRIAKLTGVSQSKVLSVLQHPLCQDYLELFRKGIEMDIEAVERKVMGIIEETLEHPNVETRLKAIDRFVKIQGLKKQDAQQVNGIQLTVIQDAREKVAGVLSEAKDFLDAEFSEVLPDVGPSQNIEKTPETSTPVGVSVESSD